MRPSLLVATALVAAAAAALAPTASASPGCTGGEPAPADHALVACIVWCGDPAGGLDPLCQRDVVDPALRAVCDTDLPLNVCIQ